MRRKRFDSRPIQVFGMLLLLHVCGFAAAEVPAPQATVAAELQALARRAATIFVGQIVSIQRKGSVVEVAFRVEQPVARTAGSTYTVREWAGLWPPGHMRYLVGQRALAFLHGTSAAGLSTPVNGSEGLVPVIVQGADAARLLDVRRVAASILRAPGTPLTAEGEGAIQLADALQLITSAETVEPARFPVPVRGRPPVDLLYAQPPTGWDGVSGQTNAGGSSSGSGAPHVAR